MRVRLNQNERRVLVLCAVSQRPTSSTTDDVHITLFDTPPTDSHPRNLYHSSVALSQLPTRLQHRAAPLRTVPAVYCTVLAAPANGAGSECCYFLSSSVARTKNDSNSSRSAFRSVCYPTRGLDWRLPKVMLSFSSCLVPACIQCSYISAGRGRGLFLHLPSVSKHQFHQLKHVCTVRMYRDQCQCQSQLLERRTQS